MYESKAVALGSGNDYGQVENGVELHAHQCFPTNCSTVFADPSGFSSAR